MLKYSILLTNICSETYCYKTTTLNIRIEALGKDKRDKTLTDNVLIHKTLIKVWNKFQNILAPNVSPLISRLYHLSKLGTLMNRLRLGWNDFVIQEHQKTCIWRQY